MNSDQYRLNQHLEAIVETNFINPPVIRIAIVKAKKLTSEEQKEAVPQDWNWTLDSHDLVKDLECKLTVAINEDLRQREEENKEKFDNVQKQKDEEKNRNKRYREQERIRNEINSTGLSRRSSYSPPSYSPPSYSPQIKGPYTCGIYWTKTRNRAEHNNHPLSKLLDKNKRWNSWSPQLTEEEIIEICKALKPSARGEYEITDVNRTYLERGTLQVDRLGRGIAWLDTGTPSSLQEANAFIEAIEKRQGLKIACLEEIAYEKGFIGRSHFRALIDALPECDYRAYMEKILIQSAAPGQG